MFYNLSDRFRRPGTLDLRCICDRAFDAHCADCPNKTVCWGLEYSNTLSTLNGLISALHTRGRVDSEQIPVHLRNRCHAMDLILDTVNRECARLTGDLLRNNRTEIFAMDYEATAKIINDALEEDGGEYCFDPVLEQQIMEYLSDAGIRADGVTVYGQRRRQILVRGADVEGATVTTETLRSDLGEMCGMYLGKAVFEVEDGISTMRLQAKRKISVLGAQNNLSADGGVSGDTVNLFSNKKDYFYALINDGMGSGREAALTSNLCSVFLEKMLRAGNRAGTSLRMLNNMLRSRSAGSTGECSSTVDLLELDLMTAEAAFIKSGASPSFVVRGETVHRLQSGTAPIGIISKLDTQIKQYSVREGDTIVLISDGIEQNDPECKWLMRYLSTCGGVAPEEIVYQICLHAAEGEVHDDCSAIALRICEAEEDE
jgi:stage II sporulation protein E